MADAVGFPVRKNSVLGAFNNARLSHVVPFASRGEPNHIIDERGFYTACKVPLLNILYYT
jgi:hypothetical protein